MALGEDADGVLSLEGVCSMLAASDGTMELDVSDIDELAGTGVIILRVTATKAKASKGKVQNWTCTGTFMNSSRENVQVAGLKRAQVRMSEDPSGSAESLKKKFVNKVQKQIEANQRSQKDDDDEAAEASARGAEERSGYGGARISPQPPAPTIVPRFAPPLAD